MTAQILKRISIPYGWEPRDWHLKLADEIPPMAVIGIFRHGTLTDKGIWFHDDQLREKAEAFLPAVTKVLGTGILLHSPAAEAENGHSHRRPRSQQHIERQRAAMKAAWERKQQARKQGESGHE